MANCETYARNLICRPGRLGPLNPDRTIHEPLQASPMLSRTIDEKTFPLLLYLRLLPFSRSYYARHIYIDVKGRQFQVQEPYAFDKKPICSERVEYISIKNLHFSFCSLHLRLNLIKACHTSVGKQRVGNHFSERIYHDQSINLDCIATVINATGGHERPLIVQNMAGCKLYNSDGFYKSRMASSRSPLPI